MATNDCPTPERHCPWNDDRIMQFGVLRNESVQARTMLAETIRLVNDQGQTLAALGAVLQRLESKVDRQNHIARRGGAAGAIGGSAVTILAALAYGIWAKFTGGAPPP